MGKSPYFRNIILILAASILLFLINKYLLLISGIALLIYFYLKKFKK